MKQFDVPIIYRSPLITAVKQGRKKLDKMKKDFTPSLLDFGPVKVFLARHFGFCYGVENAIDIAFKTIEENTGRRIYLLSEMIHNPQVNQDLQQLGVKFLQDTSGKTIIPFSDLQPNDIVLIPAFGTTLEIEQQLNDQGIQTQAYNTTCPFVEKVWNKSQQIASQDYTVIIHGKPNHEETRATFSHSSKHSPTLIIKDMAQTKVLAEYIAGKRELQSFYDEFSGQYSANFNAEKDLERIGVVNQTTMLASDTQAIADYLKQVMTEKYGLNQSDVESHFADTRDTLCYATNDNQNAVINLLKTKADFAVVVGGYNSSNTSHLVELCEEKLPTYFINSEEKMLSQEQIVHYNFHTKQEIVTNNYIPANGEARILITSGASCPDALVEGVISKLISFFPTSKTTRELINTLGTR